MKITTIYNRNQGKENTLNLMKAIYKTSTGNINLTNERLDQKQGKNISSRDFYSMSDCPGQLSVISFFSLSLPSNKLSFI